MKNRKPFNKKAGSSKPGASLPPKQADGFSVPEQYFSELPAHLRKLTLQDKEKAGFEVPEHYFDQLPDRLASLLMQEDGRKVNSFSVPDSYFDKLPLRIAERIHAGRQPAYSGSKRVLVPVALAALAMLLGALVFFLNMDPVAPVQTAEAVKNIHADDALEYLNESISDVHEEDLLDLASESSAEQAFPVAGKEFNRPPDLLPDAEQIEEYLLEQNLDETILLNHDI